MRDTMKNGGFEIRRVIVREHGFSYPTFQVVGYLSGDRVRKRFKSRDLALGEKNRLDVLAANRDGGFQAVNTRLSREQLAEAVWGADYPPGMDATTLDRLISTLRAALRRADATRELVVTRPGLGYELSQSA